MRHLPSVSRSVVTGDVAQGTTGQHGWQSRCQRPRLARTGDDVSDVTRAVTALEVAVTALREQLERAEGRADRAETAATVLRQRFEDLTAKLADAQAELAAAMDQTGDAQRELEAVQIALGEAEADAAELRQAEDARRARGLVARLRAAWRRR